MRYLLFILILAVHLCGCSSAYKLGGKKSISGTTWDYSDSDGDAYQITFKANGKMKTTNNSDRTPNNDFWFQKGKDIKFQFNNQYSTYLGQMEGANFIKGEAKSIKGTWTWELKRVE